MEQSMSHPVNSAIQEQIGEDVAELSTQELVRELGLELLEDGGTSRVIQFDAVVIDNVIVTRDELEERLSTQMWNEWPDGPI